MSVAEKWNSLKDNEKAVVRLIGVFLVGIFIGSIIFLSVLPSEEELARHREARAKTMEIVNSAIIGDLIREDRGETGTGYRIFLGLADELVRFSKVRYFENGTKDFVPDLEAPGDFAYRIPFMSDEWIRLMKKFGARFPESESSFDGNTPDTAPDQPMSDADTMTPWPEEDRWPGLSY